MMRIEDVEEIFAKHLLLKDTDIVKVALATVFANKLEGDPLWLLIIAPPSSAKTEIITSLSGIPEIYPLSSLTARTLVSGMLGKNNKIEDKSLINKLNGKIVALKDFTSVISMHREQRAEILSQLREIYDGRYRKCFGTGQITDWAGKIGIIAGVTPIIDTHYAVFTMLGERFIQFRIEAPDPIEMAYRGIDNTGKEHYIREELMTAVQSFTQSIILPENKIILPPQIKDKIAHLSAFCVKARSGSVRDGRSREIIYTPEPEAPPRLAKQFVKLGEGLVIIGRRVMFIEDDYRIIYKTGFDTIPRQRKDILYILQKSPLSAQDVASTMRSPRITADRILEELRGVGLVKNAEANGKTLWALTDSTMESLAKIKP